MSDTIETSAEQVSEERLREIVEDNFWPTRDRVLPLWNSNEAITRKEVVAIARELLSARTSTAPVARWKDVLEAAGEALGEAWTADMSYPEALHVLNDLAVRSPPPPQPGVRVTEEMVQAALDGADYTPNTDNREWMRRALTAALTASIPDSGEGWRPISTAPRDGTNVLLYTENVREYASQVVGHWGRSFFGEKWFDYSGMKPLLLAPTYWRPLPAPPSP